MGPLDGLERRLYILERRVHRDIELARLVEAEITGHRRHLGLTMQQIIRHPDPVPPEFEVPAVLGSDDPCNPGTVLTPFIWFDHNHDGTFEDGPYEMIYDPVGDFYTYNVVKASSVTTTNTQGASCDCTTGHTGTVSLHFTMNLGTTTNRYLRCLMWFCYNASPLCLQPQYGVNTAPTYAGIGTAGPPTYTPNANVGVPGYDPICNSTVTDPCNNRLGLFTWNTVSNGATPYLPSFVVTRGDASSGP